MIPRKIHYCWFGHGKKTKKMLKCMESWRHYCPDYEINEWNESNFDVYQNAYTEMCYLEKKYAFLSDYARLLIIQQEGGIYLDTDVEVMRPLDGLLVNHAFFGFEDNGHINTGLGFGAEKNSPVINKLLSMYAPLLDGTKGVIGCPILNTEALLAEGLEKNGARQTICNAEIFPKDFFNPYCSATGKLSITNNTYSIHWYAKSWMSKKSVIRSVLTRPLHRMFGTKLRKRDG